MEQKIIDDFKQFFKNYVIDNWMHEIRCVEVGSFDHSEMHFDTCAFQFNELEITLRTTKHTPWGDKEPVFTKHVVKIYEDGNYSFRYNAFNVWEGNIYKQE